MWLLRKILFPISLVYGLVVYVRNRFYDWGIFSSKSYQTPIICIGNLSTGGTGKTPMIEILIALLQDQYKIAVLSRGYRRKSTGFVLAQDHSAVRQLGDEPFQIHSKFKKVQVAVDANRQNGIEILEKQIKPNLILLDDGFQHRKVKPDFSIVLTAFDNLYVSDWFLPTGNLRDSRREAKRANILIVTKCPTQMTKAMRKEILQKLKPQPDQTILFSYLDYDTSLYGKGLLQNLDELKNKEITLVTGIANPKPLVHFLSDNGVRFEHLSFKDHHNFSSQELLKLQTKPNIITTEKDYMRLKSAIDCNYIAVKHEFFEKGLEDIKSSLTHFMTQYSSLS